jgi:hypothetical protein
MGREAREETHHGVGRGGLGQVAGGERGTRHRDRLEVRGDERTNERRERESERERECWSLERERERERERGTSTDEGAKWHSSGASGFKYSRVSSVPPVGC